MNKVVLLTLAFISSPFMLNNAQAAAISNEILLIAKSDLDNDIGGKDRLAEMDRDRDEDRDREWDEDRDEDRIQEMDRDRDRDQGEVDDGMEQKSKQKSMRKSGVDNSHMEQGGKGVREQNMEEIKTKSQQESKSWWKFWQ